MNITSVPALILAGGKTGPEFAQAAGVPDTAGSRALAQIAGQPMVAHVLKALRAAQSVSQVVVVAPSHLPIIEGADRQVAGDGGLEENIRVGMAHLPPFDHFLIATADIPFLTPEAVDDYVRRGLELDVDCCYAAISKTHCEARFPGMRRTYLRIGAEAYTGGNVVLQRASAYERQAETLREAYRRRKSPLFLARLIGVRNVLRFLAGKLELSHIEEAASRLMRVRCRLVVTPYPELGTDIDKPADLAWARAHFTGERPSG